MASREDIHITTGRYLRLLALSLILALGMACSRQSGVLPLTSAAGASHGLPFNRGSEESGISPTQAIASFTVPVGTPIVVRLSSPLSSVGTRSGDSFAAVLDDPILVQGQILLQRGAAVLGTVAAAKPFEPPNHPGYLRLTLAAVTTNRSTLQVHTSSIFAKGSWRELGEVSTQHNGASLSHQSLLLTANEVGSAPQGGDAKFSTAQRLTFRLLESLPTGR